jgi:hypothetical protein
MELPRYRVEFSLDLPTEGGGTRRCGYGEIIEGDAAPVAGLRPLNDAARIRKLKTLDPQWRLNRNPDEIDAAARECGYQGTNSGRGARAWLEAWIAETRKLQQKETTS